MHLIRRFGHITVMAFILSNRDRKKIIFEAEAEPSVNVIKKEIWEVIAAPKIKTFMWKAVWGALAVADQVISRGMKMNTRCQVCGLEGESINHLLFTCSLARRTWALSNFPFPEDGFNKVSVYENFYYLLQKRIWKNRNKFNFEGKSFDAFQTIEKISEDVNQWFLADEVEAQTQSSIDWPDDQELGSSSFGLVKIVSLLLSLVQFYLRNY